LGRLNCCVRPLCTDIIVRTDHHHRAVRIR
jgi:hypothetical protein